MALSIWGKSRAEGTGPLVAGLHSNMSADLQHVHGIRVLRTLTRLHTCCHALLATKGLHTRCHALPTTTCLLVQARAVTTRSVRQPETAFAAVQQ